MTDHAYSAMLFAREKHRNQVRKYTGCPYFLHLAEVVGIVSSIDSRDETLAVAWLHDVMEDCGVSYTDLANYFDVKTARGVQLLSDMEEGNRATRKALSRDRLASAPDWIQNIKVADLISNTSSIVAHDPKFAKVYLEEKRLLLDVLTKADVRLTHIAKIQVWNGLEAVKNAAA